MGVERRCTQRETPRRLSYVQLDRNGGGVVLNASENGLAFQVVAAVRSHGATQVCISPNPTARIELPGEIAWLDDAKTCGGVKFKYTSADIRNQIRLWLTAASNSEDLEPAATALVGVTDVTSAVAPEPRIANPALAKHREAEADSVPDRAGATVPQSKRSDGPLLRAPLFDPIPPPRDGVFVSAARFVLHITVGILVCALVLTPLLLSRNFRSQFADSLIRLGERLKGSEEAHTPPPLSSFVQSSAPNSANTSAIPDTNVGVPSEETRSQPDSSPSEITTEETKKSAALVFDDRSHSAKNLPDSHSPRRGDPLAQQLWSAVGSGDTSAEVSLAQLYIAGDGVPKNCAQARVLLKAASKRGNHEAAQELYKLNTRGCR